MKKTIVKEAIVTVTNHHVIPACLEDISKSLLIIDELDKEHGINAPIGSMMFGQAIDYYRVSQVIKIADDLYYTLDTATSFSVKINNRKEFNNLVSLIKLNRESKAVKNYVEIKKENI